MNQADPKEELAQLISSQNLKYQKDLKLIESMFLNIEKAANRLYLLKEGRSNQLPDANFQQLITLDHIRGISTLLDIKSVCRLRLVNKKFHYLINKYFEDAIVNLKQQQLNLPKLIEDQQAIVKELEKPELLEKFQQFTLEIQDSVNAISSNDVTEVKCNRKPLTLIIRVMNPTLYLLYNHLSYTENVEKADWQDMCLQMKNNFLADLANLRIKIMQEGISPEQYNQILKIEDIKREDASKCSIFIAHLVRAIKAIEEMYKISNLLKEKYQLTTLINKDQVYSKKIEAYIKITKQ